MSDVMKKLLMTVLRDRNTTIAAFRHAAGQLAAIIAAEAANFMACKQVDLVTPIAPATGLVLQHNIVLVPILRSGLVLLPAFLRNFERATVGCVGLRRDEVTAIPKLYYKNLPPMKKTDEVIVLDPMIATGGSAVAALEILVNDGVPEEKILFAAVISAPQGLAHIRARFPRITITVACEDEDLTPHKFIVPGLGDFGDRYFGTL